MSCQSGTMRVLHILDHSLPMHSGYTFRTRAIVKAQLARGWEVACLTGPRQADPAGDPEIVDGITFYRTPPPPAAPSPIAEWREIRALGARLDALVREWRPDQLHAHSPVLTALAALAGRAAARHPLALRDPRLLGGCGGRQRDGHGRLGEIPAHPAARDPCCAPRRCGGGDLRRAARRSRPARRAGGEDHRLAQRRRSGAVRRAAGARRRVRETARPGRCRGRRLHRLLLRL